MWPTATPKPQAQNNIKDPVDKEDFENHMDCSESPLEINLTDWILCKACTNQLLVAGHGCTLTKQDYKMPRVYLLKLVNHAWPGIPFKPVPFFTASSVLPCSTGGSCRRAVKPCCKAGDQSAHLGLGLVSSSSSVSYSDSESPPAWPCFTLALEGAGVLSNTEGAAAANKPSGEACEILARLA